MHSMSEGTIAERRAGGFTLIELSVVLVIVALLIGGILVTLTAQLEANRIAETRERLAQVRDAVIGFAVANGRLPCPAGPGSNGRELTDVVGGLVQTCHNGVGTFQHGFVPATTLGLVGPRDANGLLLDAWNEPIRYSVSDADSEPDGNWDFVASGELADVGLASLRADLQVCRVPAGGPADAACLDAPERIADDLPVVILSLGADRDTFLGVAVVPASELENAGEVPPPGEASWAGLVIPGDSVFVSRPPTGEPDVFDDLLEWVSPNLLFLRLVEAQVLP